MKVFAVWESEYPEDGSVLVAAFSAAGARRRHRHRMSWRGPICAQPPLTVVEMTPALMEQRGLLNGPEPIQ